MAHWFVVAHIFLAAQRSYAFFHNIPFRSSSMHNYCPGFYRHMKEVARYDFKRKGSSQSKGEMMERKSDSQAHDVFGLSRRDFVMWTSMANTILTNLQQPSRANAAEGNVNVAKDTIEASDLETLINTIPFSSSRRYKAITLSNGMKVLLVNDRSQGKSSAALTIGGAGQFSDPQDLNGLAHLMEHMTLSYTRPKGQDFDDWLDDQDGYSNGFTAYGKVCFHFSCPNDVFSPAIERFAELFYQENVEKVCQNEQILRREVRRVNSELDVTNDFTREYYLIKSLINPEHPYARMGLGNLESLETNPRERRINVGDALFDFFKKRYQPSKAILVMLSPIDLSVMEKMVAPFSFSMSHEKRSFPDYSFPRLFPKRNRIATYCLFRRTPLIEKVGDDLEKISFTWGLKLNYSEIDQIDRNIVTAPQIGFVLSQIMGRHGPGSLYTLLRQRDWIREGSLPRISFPVDVSGFQVMKLELSLTLEGFIFRTSVIAAVYDSIRSLQISPLSTAPYLLRREMIAEYMTVAQLYGYVLAPRPPDQVELAFDGQLYGIDGAKGMSNPLWHRFPLPEDRDGVLSIQKGVQETLTLMSDPLNALIITTASEKSLLRARSRKSIDGSSPRSPRAKWNMSPVTGAKYYFEDTPLYPGKVNEWLVAKSMDEELSPPVLNPLIPTNLRPARILKNRKYKVESPLVVLKNDESNQPPSDTYQQQETDPTKTSAVKDYWAVLQVISHDLVNPSLPLPREAPEPSCRCAFVLQLLSQRPARASAAMAAHSELWKISLEKSLSDIVRNTIQPITEILQYFRVILIFAFLFLSFVG